ncbi:MAG: PhnD/SsuA/transferrin family substrate-binding protein [Clostridia bacterium]|nr:PhnD/SsuA/transferrin family substrate-binding protein [Clostridia bacterium]
MKKILSFLLSVVLIFGLFGCAKKTLKNPKPTGKKVKIATLQGPTGMGMAYLLDSADKKETLNDYEYIVSAAPDELTGKIVSGELDMAALPTNAAAALYNKSNGKVKLLALNTNSVLYILSKDSSIKTLKDLKGKTVYVSGQGATPEFIFNFLLMENGLKPGEDVKLDFTYSTHSDLVAFAASGKADVVLLPEPSVTALLLKNKDMKVVVSLEDIWNETVKDTSYKDSKITMGCIAVNAAFAEENPDAVKAFLYEYEKSVNKVKDEKNFDTSAEIIAKVGIVPAAGIAKSALPRSNITFKTGEEMKKEVEGFYKVLFEAQPKSVGGKLPNADFYYAVQEK